MKNGQLYNCIGVDKSPTNSLVEELRRRYFLKHGKLDSLSHVFACTLSTSYTSGKSIYPIKFSDSLYSLTFPFSWLKFIYTKEFCDSFIYISFLWLSHSICFNVYIPKSFVTGFTDKWHKSIDMKKYCGSLTTATEWLCPKDAAERGGTRRYRHLVVGGVLGLKGCLSKTKDKESRYIC